MHKFGHAQRGLGRSKAEKEGGTLFKGEDALKFYPDGLFCRHKYCGVEMLSGSCGNWQEIGI
jgi:hypothetical protein